MIPSTAYSSLTQGNLNEPDRRRLLVLLAQLEDASEDRLLLNRSIAQIEQQIHNILNTCSRCHKSRRLSSIKCDHR